MFMEVSLDFSSILLEINAFDIFYLKRDFLEIIARQLGVGLEQPEIVSSVTCGDTSILAASAHQARARGLGIDACCLRRCLDNPRISSSIRPLPQPLRLTSGKSFSTIFIYLQVFPP